MYVPVKTIDATIQRALSAIGYKRKDIEVRPTSTISAAQASGNGRRAFIILVDVNAGTYQIQKGSWGGANMFNQRNPVDLDTATRPMPVNGVVIEGYEGESVWAEIKVHPNMLPKFLPAGNTDKPELTPELLAGLACLASCKASYRKDSYSRWQASGYFSNYRNLGDHVGATTNYAKVMQRLVELGLAKENKAGAIAITMEGKNVIAPYSYLH